MIKIERIVMKREIEREMMKRWRYDRERDMMKIKKNLMKRERDMMKI